MMTSLMRVAGVFSMQTEVHYHISALRRHKEGELSSVIDARRKSSLTALLFLTKTEKIRDEIIRIGGLTNLVRIMRLNFGGQTIPESEREIRNLARRLLGKLVLNNENIDWVSLLMAIIKNVEYKKLLILKEENLVPTSIDKGIIVVQYKHNQIKVYWPIIDCDTRKVTINEALVPAGIFDLLLPFMSLDHLENREVIRKIIQDCGCCYEPDLKAHAVHVLSSGYLGKERKDTVRELGGIPVLVSFLSSCEETLRHAARDTLAYLVEKNSLNQEIFILACAPLLSTQHPYRSWAVRKLKQMAYDNEPIQMAIINAGILPLLDRKEKKQTSIYDHDYNNEYYLVSFCERLIEREEKKKELQRLQQQAEEKKRLQAVIPAQKSLDSPRPDLGEVAVKCNKPSIISSIRNSLFGPNGLKPKRSTVAVSGEDEAEISKITPAPIKVAIAAPDATEESRDHFDGAEQPRLAKKWRIPYSTLKMEVDRIDGGGFGDVFKGRWRHQPVAIKRARKNTAPLESSSQAMITATNEAHREATIMSGLEHHYIVRFKGLVEEPNRPIMIVMEFVAGGSLYKRLYEDGDEIPWQLRLRIAHGLTCGLAFLHSERILHCDIKSKNVLLTESGEPKWCDFGLSKLKQEVQGSGLAGVTSRAN